MEYLTVEQAAEEIGTSAQMVRRWIREGRLPAERLGPVYVIRRSEAKRFRVRPRGRPGWLPKGKTK